MTRPPTPARETKSQLARRLKVHRHALDKLLARPGAPAPDRRKAYDPAAVAAFISQHKGEGSLDTLRAAKLKEIQLRCEGLRRQLARDDKQVMTIEAVNRLLRHVSEKLKSAVYDGAENTLPPRLDGQTAVECRRLLREWADGVCDEMADALTDCPVEIGFPDDLKLSA